ncbi:MAG: CPBP family intramembrane metalloprotease [Gemmatimonadetes bacterium]|nr:CPBP family intramembrane metalloprotease [Gemmatimonadota bacterium]
MSETVTAPSGVKLGAVLAFAIVTGTLSWAIARPALVGARPSFLVSFTFLGIATALVAPRLVGRRVTALGLTIGNWKTGRWLLLAGMPVALLVGFLSADSPALAAEYPLGPVTRALGSFLPHALGYLVYYVGFEFFFRGFLLLGLQERLGARRANLLQSVLAVIIHAGKPISEVAGAFPGSLVFGWLTLRTGSIWYSVALHWLVGVSLDWYIIGGP